MAFDLFRIELIVSIKDTTPYSRSMNLDILSVQFIILGYITSTNNSLYLGTKGVVLILKERAN